jgi:hypothetical protein
VTILAKPNYQFEKRQKELAKKNKKEEKRRKKVADNAAADDIDQATLPDAIDTDDVVGIDVNRLK